MYSGYFGFGVQWHFAAAMEIEAVSSVTAVVFSCSCSFFRQLQWYLVAVVVAVSSVTAWDLRKSCSDISFG